MRLTHLLCGASLAICVSAASAQTYTPGTLAAYWPMNESTASVTDVVDLSGNNNIGSRREGSSTTYTFPEVSISGPEMTTAGPTINSVTKNAVSFDGGNDILRILDSSELSFNKQKGTISLWMNIPTQARRSILKSGADASSGIAIEQTGSTGGGQYRIFFTPNSAEAMSYFMVTDLVTTNVWQHYVFTWDYTAADSGVVTAPNRVKAWVNGVAQANVTSTGNTSGDAGFTTAPTTENWVWGQRYQDTYASGNRRPFSGGMAEIAIYDTNLDATAVNTLYTTGVNRSDPDLVAYYDFSEGSGTQVADDGGGTNDVMYLSEPTPNFPLADSITGPTWVTASASGKPAYITNALSFDGTNDCVVIPRSASLAFDKNKGSVVCWAYLNATGRLGLISDSQGRWTSEAHSSTALYFQPNGSTSLFLGGARTVGTWMHLALTWDTSLPNGIPPVSIKRRMYLNGVVPTNTGSDDSAFLTGAITEDWTIGRRGILDDTANSRWYNGEFADVAIFNTKLSDADVTYIMNNGVAAFLATGVQDWTLLDN